MKKLLAALSACVLTMLSFCIPASANITVPISDRELVEKILHVLAAELYTVNPEKAQETECAPGLLFDLGIYEYWQEYSGVNVIGIAPRLFIGTEPNVLYTRLREVLDEHNLNIGTEIQSPDGMMFVDKDGNILPCPPTVMLGDLDDNEAVTLDDALAVLRGYAAGAASGETGLTEAQGCAADVDGNGEVSLDDAQHILRYYTLNTLGQRNAGWVDIVVFGA